MSRKRQLEVQEQGDRQGKQRKCSPNALGEFFLTGPSTLFALVLSFISPWRKFDLRAFYCKETRKPTQDNGYDGMVRACRTFRDRMLAMSPREISLSWPRRLFSTCADTTHVANREWDVRVTHLVVNSSRAPIEAFTNLRELVLPSGSDMLCDMFVMLARAGTIEKLHLIFHSNGPRDERVVHAALPSLKELRMEGNLCFDLRSIATSFPSLRKLVLPYFAYNTEGLTNWNHVGIDKDLDVLTFCVYDMGDFVFGETLDKDTKVLRPVRVKTMSFEFERIRKHTRTAKGIVHVEKLRGWSFVMRKEAISLLGCVVANEMHMLDWQLLNLTSPAFASLIMAMAEKKCKVHIHINPMVNTQAAPYIWCTVEEMEIIQETTIFGVRKSPSLRNPSTCSLEVVDYLLDESEGCVVLMPGMRIRQTVTLSKKVLREARLENWAGVQRMQAQRN